jgi:hypothetical protein
MTKLHARLHPCSTPLALVLLALPLLSAAAFDSSSAGELLARGPPALRARHGGATMVQQLPRVIGHRGAKAVAPENTLASIRAAKACGCSWVEVDVMLTKDKVPVIHHDVSTLCVCVCVFRV